MEAKMGKVIGSVLSNRWYLCLHIASASGVTYYIQCLYTLEKHRIFEEKKVNRRSFIFCGCVFVDRDLCDVLKRNIEVPFWYSLFRFLMNFL